MMIKLKHTISIAILSICSGFILGYNLGHKHGMSKGINITIDYVSDICKKQYDKKDSLVTRLVIINPDTATYYLSNKKK